MENLNKPRVSVIMPAYNAARFIGDAIRSVQAQTITDWELLVLDDGSTDDTCAIVKSMAEQDERIRLLPNGENMGVARTRNRGFELSRGEYIALLDSDDLWQPRKLEIQLAAMEQGAALCCCAYAIIGADGEKARADYPVPEEITYEKLLRENVIGCSTVVLRRELAQQYRFTTDFYHEDYVLWLQLLKDGHRAVGCPQVLAAWRYAADSRSFDKGSSAQNRWRIYRDFLKLPLYRCLWLFGCYALTGLRKYWKR